MNTIIPWLEHLNVLMPPGNIALVGAGNGKGIWAQWLAHQASKSRVTLIEADPLQYSILQRTLDLLGERAQHCEIRNTVVAAQQGTASFFVANSQQESGLLEPRSLLSLWPNLQTQEVKELSAITLDTLLENPNEEVELSNGEGHWLVIDCLPAGLLLQASSKLDLVDVVIARVLLGERHAVPDGTSLEEVAEFLQQNGMVKIAVEATRHPGIAYALFVRDARAALHTHHTECQKLRLIGEEQAKLLREFQAQIEQLTQAKTLAEKQIQEHEFQLRLAQENKEKAFEKIRKSLFLSLAKAAYTEKFLTNSTKNERNEKFSAEFIEFEEKNISHTSFLYSGMDFFFIHAKNDYIPRVMAEQDSFYETPFLETLASLYKPGSTIVDCGANIGNHSVFFAKVLGANVISFEPQPFNHIILMANILLNNCQSNVLLIEKGAGEKRDVLSLHMAVEDNYGSFTTEKKFIKTKSNDPSILKTFDISIEKMDDEIRFLKTKISIIKIDVEGMELSVLKGAREIIKNNFPAIAAECFTKSMFDKVKDFLSEFGYFAFDSKNATPTFIFLCKNNEFHNQIVRDFFEKSSLNKYENKKSFVDK